MARAHFVKKARKPKPEHGIKKGDSYYWWSFRISVGKRYIGRKCYSKTRPRPSQLTRSEFWSGVYAIKESHENIPDFEDLESERDAVRDELSSIEDETQSKYDNMPEGLQQGSSGEMLQGRVDAIQECISNVEGVDCPTDVDDEVDEEDGKPELESRLARIERIKELKEEAQKTKAQEVWDEVVGYLEDISCD